MHRRCSSSLFASVFQHRAVPGPAFIPGMTRDAELACKAAMTCKVSPSPGQRPLCARVGTGAGSRRCISRIENNTQGQSRSHRPARSTLGPSAPLAHPAAAVTLTRHLRAFGWRWQPAFVLLWKRQLKGMRKCL